MAEEKMTTGLSVWTNTVTALVADDFKTNGVELGEYSKECAMSAISSIYQLVKSSGEDMKNIDTSNLREVVGQCASLKLNANGYPRECYFQLRTKKIGDNYAKVVEMGIEGPGHEALLRKFGINVATVYDWWLVKEGDDFTYPKRKGLTIEPPSWDPKGLSEKTVRVVLPIKLTDGNETYLIAERESVKTNLFAHVRNNLMNETFGICQNRYKATEEQKKQIDARKEEIYAALRECETLEDMIHCEKALPYISGAWLDTFESMVIRKMQNNAVKKFPKNFDNMAKQSFVELDDTYKAAQEEVAENANAIPFEASEQDIIDGVSVDIDE